MNLFLFISIIVLSFIIVRIGAIAFHLTGLNWSQAKFQSLSCFTGTGFTTREAELITTNDQRRKIAMILMVLGNAGLVSMIATFANSIRSVSSFTKISIPFLHSAIPSSLLPFVNLIIIIIAVFIIYRIFTNANISGKITKILRKKIIEKEIIKQVSFEELWHATGGYGISQIEIYQNNQILNKSLNESGLRKQDISVLAIERKGATIPNPPA